MKQLKLFTSATIQLTAWYLAILLTISLLFSAIVFQVSTSELGSRLGAFGYQLDQQPYRDDLMPAFSESRNKQLHESKVALFVALFYLNCAIFVFGGFGSYALARRTLKPIEQSHEAQARFASDASHELRTPLAVMRSELEVALRDADLSKQEMKELLKSNLEEVNRLSDLSQTLLQLSRHDYSQVVMKRTDVHELIKSVIKIHTLDASRIHYTREPGKYSITANSESIKELLMILFDNALRYSPPQSAVEVFLAADETTVTISIKNAGKGIDGDDLPHVFERFYRGDKSRTNIEGATGYGLGLSLAKKIADVHDAVIDISSEPGKYTIAVVTLKKNINT